MLPSLLQKKKMKLSGSGKRLLKPQKLNLEVSPHRAGTSTFSLIVVCALKERGVFYLLVWFCRCCSFSGEVDAN